MLFDIIFTHICIPMSTTVTPYNDASKTKKEQVEQMFDNIAHRYDFLNHLLSAGIDRSWRKNAVKHIGEIKPKQILDVATGTGDFAFESLSLNPDKIVGFDISEGMLNVGRQKAIESKTDKIVEFVKGDSEGMPFATDTFDAITVGFGVRNFEHLEVGLKEMLRVMKPNGRVAILEVSQPHNALVRFFYSIYFTYVLPTVGKLFSKDARAYSYLPESVKAFPQGQAFVDILKKVGYKNIVWTPLTLGTCAMYTAEK